MTICIFVHLYIYIYIYKLNSTIYTCYIIKVMIFFINHFSLIISYYFVWKGFEILGVSAKVIWALFRPRGKDMTIVICHNKPPDKKMGLLERIDVVPGRDGHENLRILKIRVVNL